MIALPYLTKPRRWEPCNGCGLCCSLTLCDVAIKFFGDGDFSKEHAGPCPALEYADGRTFCGLTLHPHKYLKLKPFCDPVLVDLFQKATGQGQGCGMPDDVD